MSSLFRLMAVLLLCNCLAFAFQITGAPVPVDSTSLVLPQRREINEFALAGPEFDLYILALQRLQVREQSDPLSYFGIAGIHGYPKQSWDGVNGTGRYPGYCTHAAVVFPTWHRAYLALFEQMICQHAGTIAEMYPPEQREKYRAAAQTVRIPYWDWAVNAGLPPTTTSPTIFVNTPEGYQSIRNPLYEYIFHPGPQGNGFPAGHPLARLPATTRYLNTTTGQRNDSTATAVLLANAANTLTTTYQLLSSINNYTTMSCNYPGGSANRPINLELIHNGIHNFIGGFYGHMTWPEMAAFDPIFWLHHSNVDRLFAMWQALNPDTDIVPTPNIYGSFTELPGFVDSASSGLAPFHMDNASTLFTSDDLRDIRILGYTYPELTMQNLTTQEQASYIRSQVNELYAPMPKSSARSTNDKDKRSDHGSPLVTLKQAKQLAVNNAATQWSITIQVSRAAFNTSYNLDFFMGSAPIVSQRSTADNLIATYGLFVTDRTCDTEIEMMPIGILLGEVSLTHVLSAAVSQGTMDNLSPASVVPILQKHLTWAARTSEDQDIDVQHLDGLSIAVNSRQVQPRTADCEFPVYGNVTVHPEATRQNLVEFAPRGMKMGPSRVSE